MLPDPYRRIEVENIGDVSVVTFPDQVIPDGEHSGMTVFDALFTPADGIGRRKVLLNFGNVEFWSSAVLGKLITLHRKAQAVRGRLVLCKLPPDLLEVFRTISLDRIFTIVTDPAGVGGVISQAFGNPFRSAGFSPEWRTDTVRLLAQQMDESGDFSPMPILADALQDAGCDNDDILNHCRSGSEYLQEGWVVDLVLGE